MTQTPTKIVQWVVWRADEYLAETSRNEPNHHTAFTCYYKCAQGYTNRERAEVVAENLNEHYGQADNPWRPRKMTITIE